MSSLHNIIHNFKPVRLTYRPIVTYIYYVRISNSFCDNSFPKEVKKGVKNRCFEVKLL